MAATALIRLLPASPPAADAPAPLPIRERSLMRHELAVTLPKQRAMCRLRVDDGDGGLTLTITTPPVLASGDAVVPMLRALRQMADVLLYDLGED